MMLKGIVIGAAGLVLLLLAISIPFLNDYAFIVILKALLMAGLALISLILLIIAWKLIRFNPPPPAASLI